MHVCFLIFLVAPAAPAPSQLPFFQAHAMIHLNPATNVRTVPPYPHEYVTHTKARWVGSTLLTLFTREFASHDESYFRAAILHGCITVNGRVSALDTVLRDGDKIVHRVHRHEAPVPGDAIRVLQPEGAGQGLVGEQQQQQPGVGGLSPPPQPLAPAPVAAAPFIAINKPGGIPTHSCGAHNYLSVPHIMAQECGHPMGSLFTVHRLDRVTSGVLLLGRSKVEAASLSALLRGAPGSGSVRKRYFALVQGDFPRAPISPSPPAAATAITAASASLLLDASHPEHPYTDFAITDSSHSVRLQELGCVAVHPALDAPPCPWIAAFQPFSVTPLLSEEGGEVQGQGQGPPLPPPASGQKRKREGEVASKEAGVSSAIGESAGVDIPGATGSSAAPLPTPPPSISWTPQGYLRVDVPLRSQDAKHAIHGVAVAGESGGGESVTLFRAIASVGGGGGRAGGGAEDAGARPLTLIQCIPLSGRSHQIRVHLAHLGFPIWDDPVYCTRAAAELSRRDKEEGGAGVSEQQCGGSGSGSGSGSATTTNGGVGEGSKEEAALPPPPPLALPAPGTPGSTGEELLLHLQAVCTYCTRGGARAEFSPLQRLVGAISLHSAEYAAWGEGSSTTGPLWCVLAPLPGWVRSVAEAQVGGGWGVESPIAVAGGGQKNV